MPGRGRSRKRESSPRTSSFRPREVPVPRTPIPLAVRVPVFSSSAFGDYPGLSRVSAPAPPLPQEFWDLKPDTGVNKEQSTRTQGNIACPTHRSPTPLPSTTSLPPSLRVTSCLTADRFLLSFPGAGPGTLRFPPALRSTRDSSRGVELSTVTGRPGGPDECSTDETTVLRLG